jgi:hypothetical protein
MFGSEGVTLPCHRGMGLFMSFMMAERDLPT